MNLLDSGTIQKKSELNLESVRELVHNFYTDVRADEVLAPTFNLLIGDHWDEHLERLVSFWATISLGTRSFSGNVFGKHMAIPGVTPEHFERWLRLWFGHTNALFPEEIALEFQGTAAGIARNLHHGFFANFADFNEITAKLENEFQH